MRKILISSWFIPKIKRNELSSLAIKDCIYWSEDGLLLKKFGKDAVNVSQTNLGGPI